MKNLSILILILCLTWTTRAQTTLLCHSSTLHRYDEGQPKKFNLTPKGTIADITLLFENLYADIVLEGVAGNEIEVVTNHYAGIPEKAKGLKPLSATGTDNTGMGLSIAQEGNVIKVSGASRKADGIYTFKVPENIKVKVDVESWHAGDLEASNLSNQVEVTTQGGDLTFQDITGPLVASTINGDIEVTFSSLNQTTPTSITSTSGDIDITLPDNTKGTFELGTISGEIFTDLDFTFSDEEGMRRMTGGMQANATLNGGGVAVTFKSISGDVLIRKGK